MGFLPLQNINSNNNDNQTKYICAESVSDLPHKISCQPEKVICDTIVDNELNPNIQKGDNPDKDKNESNQIKSAVETQNPRKDFNDEVNNEIDYNDYIRNQSNEKKEKRI